MIAMFVGVTMCRGINLIFRPPPNGSPYLALGMYTFNKALCTGEVLFIAMML